MKNKIDMAVAFLILLTLCFVAFLLASGSLPVAMTLTYVSGVIARFAYVKWNAAYGEARKNQKARMRHARSLVAKWSIMPDEELAKRFVNSVHDADADFALVPIHSQGPAFGVNDLTRVWRENIGKERLIIAATGNVDDSALTICRALDHPRVAVLDEKELTRAIADSPLDIPEADAPSRPRRVKIAIDRKHAPRIAMCAASTLLIFFVTGKLVYLVCGSSLIFLSGMSLIKKPKAKGLF
ncbi:MAG: hypothetical protein Q4D04_09790 [Clostridia bacterium]|nr:hypothetical protein [Clostridia bacterium]